MKHLNNVTALRSAPVPGIERVFEFVKKWDRSRRFLIEAEQQDRMVRVLSILRSQQVSQPVR